MKSLDADEEIIHDLMEWGWRREPGNVMERAANLIRFLLEENKRLKDELDRPPD